MPRSDEGAHSYIMMGFMSIGLCKQGSTETHKMIYNDMIVMTERATTEIFKNGWRKLEDGDIDGEVDPSSVLSTKKSTYFSM